MKYLILPLLIFCSYLLAGPVQGRSMDSYALLHLTASLGISPDADLIAATQKQWLRKPGRERWEMEELSDAQRELVIQWGREQGFLDPWKPKYNNYDKAVILGGAHSLRNSLQYRQCRSSGG